MTPNALNNKAVDLLNGDRTSVAEEVLEQSLELCPHHPEATYNRGLIRWRSGGITDEEFIAQLEEARPHTSARGMIDYLLGLVHIERGDRTAALKASRAAKLDGDDRLRQLATESLSTVESDQGRWGRCVSREYAPKSTVLSVSSDGRWMVSANPYPEVLEPDVGHLFEDRRNENKGFPYLVLWDLEAGVQVRQLDGSKEVRGKLDVEQVDSGECISHFSLIFEPIAERMFLGCAVKACFDATGRHLVSGHADGLLRLWNVATGRCIRVFRQQQPGGVSCLAFSPDGRWVVSGGTGTTACRTWEYADPWVWLWEIESGQCARRFEGHEGHVSSVAFSPDGRRVLSTSSSIWGQGGSADSTPRVWDVTTGGCLETTDQIASPTKLVGFNSDGSIHSIIGGNETHVGGDESGGPLQTIGLNTGNRVLSRAVISRNAKYVLSTEFSDGAARLWEIPSGRCLSTLRFERFKSLDVAFPTDGSTALLYGESRMHRLELPDYRRSPWVLAPIRSADVESAYEEQFSASLSEARRALERRDIASALHALRAARNLPGRNRTPDVLDLWNQAGLKARHVELRDAWAHGPPIKLDSVDHRACDVHFKDDGWHALVLSTPQGEVIQLVAGPTGSCELAMTTPEKQYHHASLSSDGMLAVSLDWADREQRLRVWDLRSGQCSSILEPSGEEDDVTPTNAIFSQDRRWIMAGASDQTTRIVDTDDGKLLCAFVEPGRSEDDDWGWIKCLCLSRDDRMAVSVMSSKSGEGNSTEVVRLWELATGRCIRSFSALGEAVNAACFSPDGRWVLTGQTSKPRRPVCRYDEEDLEHKFNWLRLWDIATGRCIRKFTGCIQKEVPNSVCFTPDGLWAVSCHGDYLEKDPETRTIRVWHVRSGKCIKVLRGHTEAVTGVWISPDARWLISTAHDGTIRQWTLDWDLDVPRSVDWDDGALPFLENFLTLHTPYESAVPTDSEPSEQQVRQALTRKGSPSWSEQDFQELVRTLGYAGYGWIRPDGVRTKLEQIATDWMDPPPLNRAGRIMTPYDLHVRIKNNPEIITRKLVQKQVLPYLFWKDPPEVESALAIVATIAEKKPEILFRGSVFRRVVHGLRNRDFLLRRREIPRFVRAAGLRLIHDFVERNPRKYATKETLGKLWPSFLEMLGRELPSTEDSDDHELSEDMFFTLLERLLAVGQDDWRWWRKDDWDWWRLGKVVDLLEEKSLQKRVDLIGGTDHLRQDVLRVIEVFLRANVKAAMESDVCTLLGALKAQDDAVRCSILDALGLFAVAQSKGGTKQLFGKTALSLAKESISASFAPQVREAYMRALPHFLQADSSFANLKTLRDVLAGLPEKLEFPKLSDFPAELREGLTEEDRERGAVLFDMAFWQTRRVALEIVGQFASVNPQLRGEKEVRDAIHGYVRLVAGARSAVDLVRLGVDHTLPQYQATNRRMVLDATSDLDSLSQALVGRFQATDPAVDDELVIFFDVDAGGIARDEEDSIRSLALAAWLGCMDAGGVLQQGIPYRPLTDEPRRDPLNALPGLAVRQKIESTDVFDFQAIYEHQPEFSPTTKLAIVVPVTPRFADEGWLGNYLRNLRNLSLGWYLCIIHARIEGALGKGQLQFSDALRINAFDILSQAYRSFEEELPRILRRFDPLRSVVVDHLPAIMEQIAFPDDEQREKFEIDVRRNLDQNSLADPIKADVPWVTRRGEPISGPTSIMNQLFTKHGLRGLEAVMLCRATVLGCEGSCGSALVRAVSDLVARRAAEIDEVLNRLTLGKGATL